MSYLPIILAIIFICAGLSKLLGFNFQKIHFRHWNLPHSTMYGIGTMELISAFGLLNEWSQYVAAILGSFILVGAVCTCWVVSDYKRSILPLVLLLSSWTVVWMNAPATNLTYLAIGLMTLTLFIAAILWAYPTTAFNREGDVEYLDINTKIKHHFIEVLGVNYHFITAGNPKKPVVFMVHGAPESWYTWHQQIIALSKTYYVIAPDMKPYGQTGKDLDGDHSFPNIANELKALLETLEIEKCHIVSHDRGVIATDHLLSKTGMARRISSYIRMQQSFNEPHGEPLPPHHLMGSFLGTMAYKLRFGLRLLYQKSDYVKIPIDKKIVRRLVREFQFKGIPGAVPLTFKTTSFQKELKDRQDHLFQFMTMPVLILQGRYDPGQHPEEYDQSHTVVPNLRVQFVASSHFTMTEVPNEINEIILSFFNEHTYSGKSQANHNLSKME